MSDIRSLVTRLAAASRDLTLFQPEMPHRKARATFWSHFQGEGAIPVPPSVDLSIALKYSGDKRLSQWWVLPGFQDWFLNAEEFQQRVEFLSQLALDSLEESLTSKTVPLKDKLLAAKMVLEIGDKFPGRKSSAAEEYLDARIAGMDRRQLEEYITRNIQRIPPALELTPSPSDGVYDILPSK